MNAPCPLTIVFQTKTARTPMDLIYVYVMVDKMETDLIAQVSKTFLLLVNSKNCSLIPFCHLQVSMHACPNSSCFVLAED